MEKTELIYRTESGGEYLKGGSFKELINDLDVSLYRVIRVAAINRGGATVPISIGFTLVEDEQFLISMASFTLNPGTSFNEVYDIPGRTLRITASAKAGYGGGTLELLIYGRD